MGDVTGHGVLRLLLQPWEAREVAVVFTPSEHKPTTTILIIRYLFTISWMFHNSEEFHRSDNFT